MLNTSYGSRLLVPIKNHGICESMAVVGVWHRRNPARVLRDLVVLGNGTLWRGGVQHSSRLNGRRPLRSSHRAGLALGSGGLDSHAAGALRRLSGPAASEAAPVPLRAHCPVRARRSYLLSCAGALLTFHSDGLTGRWQRGRTSGATACSSRRSSG